MLHMGSLRRHDIGTLHPGGAVAEIPCSQRRGPRFHPGQGTSSHVLQFTCHKEAQRSHMLQLRTSAVK